MSSALVLVMGAALLLQQADAQVQASLSDDRIAVGGSTLLQITVEASGGRPDEIELPALPPSLDVLSSREYTQTQLSLPGGRTTLVRRDIVLRARTEGMFTIPPATVRMPDGSVHRTRPLTLRVVATSGGYPPLRGPRAAPGRTAAGDLRVSIAPDTAWIGEPVLLRMTARIPEEQRTRRGRSPTFEPPTAPGFWVQEVDDRGAVGVRAVGAQYYDVHEYRRLYVPLTSGRHVLPAGRAVYEVDRGWMFAPETYELVADSVILPVRSLPTAGRPGSFTGAVGRFQVRARLENTELTPGDAATLTVEIEGSGNIKALPAPRLADMPGIEVFPPSEDATFTARTSGIRGVKRFRWMLVPARPGRLAVPAVEYAWFDPQSEQYHTARIELPPLAVRRMIAAAAPEDTALAPLRIVPAPEQPLAWAGSAGFALLQLAPILLFAVAFAWRREAPRLRAARAVRRGRDEAFDRARRHARTDPRSALGDLEHALDAALVAATGAAAADDAALRSHGVGEDVIASLATLRSAMRTMRFRPEPVGAGEVESLVQRAELVLRRIERARRRRRAVAAGALAPFLLLAPAADTRAHDAHFPEAVAAYERGDFDDARTGFVAHLDRHPHDASAWYDLGNTDFRRGARGAAIHAWAHALRLQPRADDARHNLIAVEAREAATVARAPVPFTTNELRAFAGLAWLLGGALLALRIAGRGRRARLAGAAGATAVLLGAVALLALAGRTGWPDSAVVVRSAPVRAGPALRAEVRSTLEEGALPRLVETRGDWVRVRTGNHEGWMEQRDLGRI